MANLFELAPVSTAFGEQLNAQQKAAVEHGDGPLLVVAGAGTGKTRVITERIRHLLASDPELPGNAILGLTFTDKAAAEMKHRVAKTAGERGGAVCLGTFHGFCNSLLLERDPQLKTLEKEDHWVLLRRNLAVLALERYRRLAEPGQFLGDFVQFFSRCQDELVTPDDYERYVASLAEHYASGARSASRGRAAAARRRDWQAAGDCAGLPGERPAVARTPSAYIWYAIAGRSACARCRSGFCGERAPALSVHPGGRVPGYQRRTNRAAVALGWRASEHRCGGGQRAGDLPVSRRVVWQLHDFSGALCGRAQVQHTGSGAFCPAADRQLPLDRTDLARGRASGQPDGAFASIAGQRADGA